MDNFFVMKRHIITALLIVLCACLAIPFVGMYKYFPIAKYLKTITERWSIRSVLSS